HGRYDVDVGLELGVVQHLGERAVGDTQPQADHLQLLVDVEPRAAARLDRRQRREQGVDRGRGGLRRLFRFAGGLPATARVALTAEAAGVATGAALEVAAAGVAAGATLEVAGVASL